MSTPRPTRSWVVVEAVIAAALAVVLASVPAARPAGSTWWLLAAFAVAIVLGEILRVRPPRVGDRLPR